MTTFKIRFFFLFLFSLLTSHIISAQDTIKKFVNINDSVDLRLIYTSYNYGDIQWQRSDNGTEWYNVNDQKSKDYFLRADTTALYRAAIIAGTCDPVYSRISQLTVQYLLGNLENVTDTSALIYGSISVNGVSVVEHGILFDSTASLYPQSSKMIDTSSNWNDLKYSFNNLTPGKTYYTKLYILTSTGIYIYGNSLNFTTINAASLNRVDNTDSTARYWYKVSGTVPITEQGIFYDIQPTVDTSSAKILGLYDNSSSKILDIIMGKKRSFADMTNLKADSSYYVRAFLKTGNKYYLDNVQKITTSSDYSNVTIDTAKFNISHKIVWNDQSTAKRISVSFGDYGRVKRFGNSDTLLLVYHGGPNILDWVNIYMRKSYDNGVTWGNEEIIKNINDYRGQYYRFCNPELLVLKNGWILLAYEANSIGDENNSSVQIIISKDTCKTWQDPVIIRTGRSWEPAMVQLPHGEIELFYSSEANWWPSVDGSYIEQEIMEISSNDNGQTWSSPKTVAYYPGKRDGMPVPLLLQGNKGVVFTIETVNNNNSPYIISRNLNQPWILATNNYDNGLYRWYAGDFGGHGGAPYIIQLPTGETVLSVHRYRGGDWHQNNDMKVMIGDNSAKNFEQLSTPYNLPKGESAVNNSLFLKNDSTIVAISCRMMANGTDGGIYWLEGSIQLK